jgi:hypothetical protein
MKYLGLQTTQANQDIFLEIFKNYINETEIIFLSPGQYLKRLTQMDYTLSGNKIVFAKTIKKRYIHSWSMRRSTATLRE